MDGCRTLARLDGNERRIGTGDQLHVLHKAALGGKVQRCLSHSLLCAKLRSALNENLQRLGGAAHCGKVNRSTERNFLTRNRVEIRNHMVPLESIDRIASTSSQQRFEILPKRKA